MAHWMTKGWIIGTFLFIIQGRNGYVSPKLLIIQIKINNSPGYDEMFVEITKAVRQIGMQLLYHILRKI